MVTIKTGVYKESVEIMMKNTWDEDDYNEAVLLDDRDKDAGAVTRRYWNDMYSVMNSVFGEAAVLEAIEWIKKTGDKALVYGYGIFGRDGMADSMETFLCRYNGTKDYSGEDIKVMCRNWSEAIIEMGLMGVYNPQLVFLTSDLYCYKEPATVIRAAVKKHGAKAVLDIIDKLYCYYAPCMEHLAEILESDDPYGDVCERDGSDYGFETDPARHEESSDKTMR